MSSKKLTLASLLLLVFASAQADDFGECNDPCQQFQSDAQLAETAVSKGGKCTDPNGNTLDCKTWLKGKWGVAGPNCMALSTMVSAHDAYRSTVDSTKAVATACAAACAAEIFTGGIAVPIAKAVCSGFEAADMFKEIRAAKSLHKWKDDQLEALLGSADDQTNSLLSNTGEKVQGYGSAAMDDAMAIKNGVQAAEAAKLLKNSRIISSHLKDGLKNLKSKILKGVCLDAVLYAILYEYKSKAIANHSQDESQVCMNIMDLYTKNNPVSPVGGPSPRFALSGNPVQTINGNQPLATRQGGSVQRADKIIQGANDMLQNPQYSMAVAGNDPFISNLPNREKIPDALKEMGLSMKDIHDSVDRGTGVGAMVAGLSGMDSAASMLADMDSKAKGASQDLLAKFPDAAASSQYASVGGAGNTGAIAARKSLFGFDMDSKSGDPTTEMKFEKMRAPAALSGDGDIWHTEYKGSIFEIVSSRLAQSRDRVEKLDWVTPLNRALLGLPNKKGENL